MHSGCHIALTAASLVLATSASADVTTAYWIDSSHFEYEISHMPDLDQRRDGLDLQGDCHCVPTSCMNMVAYIANHGFDEVTPGFAHWQYDEMHPLGTAVVGFLGIMMNVNDDGCGTGGSDANNGLIDWMAPYPDFVVNDHLSDGNFSTRFETIAESLIDGNLGTMSYGRYTLIGWDYGLGIPVPVLDRGGGHSTTVIRCFADGDDKFIWVRDPADDNPIDRDTQSPFKFKEYQPVNLLVKTSWGGNYRVMSVIDFPDASDNRYRIIDGHRTIRPLSGLSPQGSGVVFNQPFDLQGSPNPSHDPIMEPSGLTVYSLACQPGAIDIYTIVGQENTIATVRHLNRLSEQWTNPGIAARMVLVGRQRQVYTLFGNDKMRCYPAGDLSADPVLYTSPYKIDLWAFDDATDQLVAISKTAAKVLEFDKDFATAPTVRDLPSIIPASTLTQLTINPVDRTRWVLGEHGCQYWFDALALTGANLCHPEFPNLTSFDFDSHGRMYVVENGLIEVYEPGDGPWGWARNAASPFNGTPSGDGLCIARHRNNVDPAIHDTPAWHNIDADELKDFGREGMDCPGDFNGDNTIDAVDLNQLLQAWGDNPGHFADLNGDDLVDAIDLSLLLQNWGACFVDPV